MVYKSPGVYTKEVQLSNPIINAGLQRVVGIVGTGSATIEVNNTEVVRGAGSTDVVVDPDAGTIASLLGLGSIPSLFDYVLGTDYTYDSGTATITWINAPTAGAVFYASYLVTKDSSYYDPITFYDLDSIRAYYGKELSAGVVNEITVAAKLAFAGGAAQITVVQATDATTTNIEAAVDKLETEDIDVLVAPGVTLTAIQTYITQHVNKMNSEIERKERVYFTSTPTITDSVSTITGRATAFSNENITVIAPPVCTVTLTDGLCQTEVTEILSGNYSAAVLAGIATSPVYNEAEPITNKIVPGLAGLNNVKYKESEIRTLASNGVTVLYNDNGTIKVRHALTTNPANVNTAELEVIMVKMATKKELRTALKPYIGTRYVATTVNALLTGAVKSFCQQKVNDQVYNEYRNIIVTENPDEPRQALIHFEFKPVLTLTWIEISFGLYTK